MTAADATANTTHDADEVSPLVRAVHDILRSDPHEVAEFFAGMPLMGVLFLAMIRTAAERAAMDSPLALVLSAIRDTIDGWARTPSPSTTLADIPFAELDRLGHRVSAAIEIARRSGQRRDGDQ
jgi:hypothetical protein